MYVQHTKNSGSQTALNQHNNNLITLRFNNIRKATYFIYFINSQFGPIFNVGLQPFSSLVSLNEKVREFRRS